MLHINDEAMEQGEKIAKAAEKNKPKTPEERCEEMIEEATGVEKPDGLLADARDDLAEVTEEAVEALDEEAEAMEELSEVEMQATGAWGRELPSICKDTFDAANKLFDDYYASKNQVTTEE